MSKLSIEQIIDNFIADKKLIVTKLNLPDCLSYNCNKEHLLQFLSFLKDSTKLRFTILTDLFAADFPSKPKRFEVVYSVLSLELNKRLLIKVDLAENEQIASVVKYFSAACWYEREVFDMFGVIFEGAADLRRILTDYGFVGHPLRKDFPVTGHLQVRYDEKLERVIYEPVVLDQEFRMFDFLSPWQGADYVLPGDEKATK